MKSILCAWMLLLVAQLIRADIPVFRPDYQYVQGLDGYIKFHLVPATWNDAMFRCNVEGAVLASPLTKELMIVMMAQAASFELPRTLFTGFSDHFFKGEYQSVEGVPLGNMQPVSWALTEPNNLDNSEDCLVIDHEGLMADVNCRAVYSYMCYKKMTDDMPPMNECGTTDPEYHRDEHTGSCYKYHPETRHWSRAFETCAAEGGHLAIVNSGQEARLLKDMFFSGPRSMVMSIHTKMILLGFRYNEDLGHWMTVNGHTLDQVGYSTWENGEPNNYTDSTQNGEGEYCGAMDMGKENLGLNDLWCGYSQPFICEKDSNTLPIVSTTTSTTPESDPITEQGEEVQSSTDTDNDYFYSTSDQESTPEPSTSYYTEDTILNNIRETEEDTGSSTSISKPSNLNELYKEETRTLEEELLDDALISDDSLTTISESQKRRLIFTAPESSTLPSEVVYNLDDQKSDSIHEEAPVLYTTYRP